MISLLRVPNAARSNTRKLFPAAGINSNVRRSHAVNVGFGLTAAVIAGGVLAMKRGSIKGSTQMMAQGGSLATMLTASVFVKNSNNEK